jgi:hypothetical protein
MRRKRSGFTPAATREVGKQNVNQAAANFSEGVAVEKEKRSGAVTAKEKIQRFRGALSFGRALLPIGGGLSREFPDYGCA